MALKMLGVCILVILFVSVVLFLTSESKRTQTLSALVACCFIIVGLVGYGIAEIHSLQEQRFRYNGQLLPVSQISDILSEKLSSENGDQDIYVEIHY